MQPQMIHWREAMPLNPNGKIDRTALQMTLKAQQNGEFGK
jgi:acyl-coenzyme A synthetase/AMP-(fatty) acid ligase